MHKHLILVGFTLFAAQIAQAAPPVDKLATKAIASSDYRTAEALLSARLARAPGLQQAMINLAHVYRATGKTTEAAALYQRVLKRPNIQLETTREAPAWSHDLAERGLNALSQP